MDGGDCVTYRANAVGNNVASFTAAAAQRPLWHPKLEIC